MYINKAFLYGNLTRDPEVRALPSGVKVASFALATNRTYKDKDGNKKDVTEFHNIVAFAKPAELIAQYMKKGRPMFIEGRMQTQSWDDKTTGVKKYRTEIVVENFQFGPSTPGSGAGGSYPSAGASSNKQSVEAPQQDKAPMDTIEYPSEDINAEDIPF
ncbi:MAG: single-stranded DNA-binding protein [Candidatus Paceibacterota bacterium]|jgi:single-strand DNA-binding protein